MCDEPIDEDGNLCTCGGTHFYGKNYVTFPYYRKILLCAYENAVNEYKTLEYIVNEKLNLKFNPKEEYNLNTCMIYYSFEEEFPLLIKKGNDGIYIKYNSKCSKRCKGKHPDKFCWFRKCVKKKNYKHLINLLNFYQHLNSKNKNKLSQIINFSYLKNQTTLEHYLIPTQHKTLCTYSWHLNNKFELKYVIKNASIYDYLKAREIKHYLPIFIGIYRWEEIHLITTLKFDEENEQLFISKIKKHWDITHRKKIDQEIEKQCNMECSHQFNIYSNYTNKHANNNYGYTLHWRFPALLHVNCYEVRKIALKYISKLDAFCDIKNNLTLQNYYQICRENDFKITFGQRIHTLPQFLNYLFLCKENSRYSNRNQKDNIIFVLLNFKNENKNKNQNKNKNFMFQYFDSKTDICVANGKHFWYLQANLTHLYKGLYSSQYLTQLNGSLFWSLPNDKIFYKPKRNEQIFLYLKKTESCENKMKKILNFSKKFKTKSVFIKYIQ